MRRVGVTDLADGHPPPISGVAWPARPRRQGHPGAPNIDRLAACAEVAAILQSAPVRRANAVLGGAVSAMLRS